VLLIKRIILLLLLLIAGCGKPDPIALTHTMEISSSMEFIGLMLRDGDMYCVDNLGIELVYGENKTYITMKQMCDIILKEMI